MDLNSTNQKIDELEKKVSKLNANVEILGKVFEGILDQFEKIKQDLNK